MSVGRKISLSVKNLIFQYHSAGFSILEIQRQLKNVHRFITTRSSVHRIVKRYKDTGSFQRIKKGNPTKVKHIHLEFIDLWLSQNREQTSTQIKKRLFDVFGLDITKQYVSQLRRQLGWTTRNVKYCQLISHNNKYFRMNWCCEALSKLETFRDVIFVDETNVEMSATGRLFFYKPGSQLDKIPPKASKPKHAYKVHMWGGISYRGRTDCCVFTGIMDSVIYQGILKDNFLPFVEAVFPDGYRLYQDNDSKHKSKSTTKWYEDQGMKDKVMVTPASSPDLNPIENVWSAMKNHLQRKVKPRTKDQLVHGIKSFWESLTAEACGKYIDHIHRVIPHVILNNGGPSKF